MTLNNQFRIGAVYCATPALAGAKQQLIVPIGRQGHAMQLFAFRLPPEEGRRLRRRARSEKVTPSAVIRAAWREYDNRHDNVES